MQPGHADERLRLEHVRGRRRSLGRGHPPLRRSNLRMA
jgi:hypothetical protein